MNCYAQASFLMYYYIIISLSNVLLSDRRLADHFGGKLHLGYMQIREKLADLLVIY